MFVIVCAWLLIPSSVHAQSPLASIDTVTINDEGNVADVNGYGAVAYTYQLGRYEVTIGQYIEFLNSAAAVDIYGLYNPNMETNPDVASILRSGDSGSYTYSAIGNSNRPVVYVSWFDAARFANWLNNGATNGASTETGAYTLNGATNGIISKNPDASWWIPSEDEWYKGAYYKGGGTNTGYWSYATQSDTLPNATATTPGNSNSANFNDVRPAGDKLTEVGAYSSSPSSYFTYDQSGNVYEWNDAVIDGNLRGLRGSDWRGNDESMASSYRYYSAPDTEEWSYIGFRVATVPEPSTYALLLLSGAVSLWALKRRKS